MDELIKMVMSQADLDEVVAKQVVELVLDQLKGKLPVAITDHFDEILAGDIDAASLLQGDAKGIMGMFAGWFKS